jgi:hypothetical protein
VNNTPKLIDLDALASEIVQHAVLVPSARAPGIDNELEHGRFAHPGYAPAVKEGWLDARLDSPVVRIEIMDWSGTGL